MSTTPSIPGVDRDALVNAIRKDIAVSGYIVGSSGYIVGSIADVALAHIAAHHECALPATWDDGGARPVEGEHGWVTPLLPDGSQRFPDGTPVEAWHPGYGDGLRSLYYVEGGKHADARKPGATRFAGSWHEGTLIRPALPPTAPACDREHADEWVEVDVDIWGSLPEGTRLRVRSEWVKGDNVGGGPRRFVHRDDLPDDPRTLIAREIGPAKADTFLGLLRLIEKHGWTVTRKEER